MSSKTHLILIGEGYVRTCVSSFRDKTIFEIGHITDCMFHAGHRKRSAIFLNINYGGILGAQRKQIISQEYFMYHDVQYAVNEDQMTSGSIIIQ